MSIILFVHSNSKNWSCADFRVLSADFRVCPKFVDPLPFSPYLGHKKFELFGWRLDPLPPSLIWDILVTKLGMYKTAYIRWWILKAGFSLNTIFKSENDFKKANLCYEKRSVYKTLGKFRKLTALWRNFLQKIDQKIWYFRFWPPPSSRKCPKFKAWRFQKWPPPSS